MGMIGAFAGGSAAIGLTGGAACYYLNLSWWMTCRSVESGIRGQTGRFPNNLRVNSFVPKLRDGMAPTHSSPLFPYP